MATSPVITVSAYKGGVGKTTLALELAAALGGVLVDLDWDRGGATGTWGTTSPTTRCVVGLARGERVPRPLHAAGRPDIVPSHPALAALRVDPAVVAGHLRWWAETYGVPTVLDTHSGAVALTDAAWAAADLVVVPTLTGWPELRALEGLLEERAGRYPLLVVPNRVHGWAVVRPQLLALVNLGRQYRVPVAPFVSDYPWLPRRQRRAALVLAANPGRAVAAAAAEVRGVADAVARALATPAPTLEVSHA